MQGARQGLGHAARFADGADNQGAGLRVLRLRGVKLGCRRVVQAKFTYVSNHPYDIDPVFSPISRDALSDWIFVWPELVFCCFIDDSYVRCLILVGFRQQPSRFERNTKGFEIVRRNCGKRADRRSLTRFQSAAFNLKLEREGFRAAGNRFRLKWIPARYRRGNYAWF